MTAWIPWTSCWTVVVDLFIQGGGGWCAEFYLCFHCLRERCLGDLDVKQTHLLNSELSSSSSSSSSSQSITHHYHHYHQYHVLWKSHHSSCTHPFPHPSKRLSMVFHLFFPPRNQTHKTRENSPSQVILQTRFHLIMADPCMTEVAIYGWLFVFCEPPKNLGSWSLRKVVLVVIWVPQNGWFIMDTWHPY